MKKHAYLLVVAISLLNFSCKDNANSEIVEQRTQHQAEINQAKNPYLIALGIYAAVQIAIKLAEGQWSKETIYNNEGKPIGTREKCSGVGVCKAQGNILSNNAPLSYRNTYDDSYFDYNSSAYLGSKENNVILGMIKSEADEEAFNKFFYDEIINISAPLIIDNRDILNRYKAEDPITVQGDYHVYKEDDFYYIIIK